MGVVNQRYAQIYQLPLLHLDSIQFLENWEEREEAEATQLVKTFLEEHSNWVIDGNYTQRFYEERLAKADKIIILEFSRWQCLKRVTQRYLTYRHQTRPDMTQGCEEKLDMDFIKWILYKGRSAEISNNYQRLKDCYPSKVYHLKNQKELDIFIKKEGLL